MSVKRQATSELNHENWDQDDPEDEKEMGAFKIATREELDKRVIRTAKRRAPISSGDGEQKKGVFSGFGGFNKAQPSSFDFLAKLTEGAKNKTNGSATKSDVTATSTLFSSQSPSNKTGSGLFSFQSSPQTSTPTFGIPFSKSPTTENKPGSMQSLFTASKADSTVGDSPFKNQPVSSSVDTKANSSKGLSPKASLFGVSSTSTNVTKTPFSTTSSSLFKMTSTASTTETKSTNNCVPTTELEKEIEDKADDKKMIYYNKLRGLNEAVSDWIKKHVEQTPLCILSPIFKDYEKHLKEMQDEFHSADSGESNKKADESLTKEATVPKEPAETPKTSTLFSNKLSANIPNSNSLFPTQNNTTPEKPKFSFGINNNSVASSTSSTVTTSNAGFTFGTSTTASSAVTSTSSPFSFATNTATSAGSSQFSFGGEKPFSFKSNIAASPTTETTKEDKEDEDEPPKVDFTPLVEENSVYDKRCKIFVKKDGNFADKGVGTLYIKKIESSGKHQLLVRANTSLGNVLLNLVLASAVPVQRMGKNNVMLVCVPTPEAMPPPTPVLVRVKTGEEADELLETLNKYKS